jgi:hypothetical protein
MAFSRPSRRNSLQGNLWKGEKLRDVMERQGSRALGNLDCDGSGGPRCQSKGFKTERQLKLTPTILGDVRALGKE